MAHLHGHATAARRAGLRWVRDAERGYRRERCGRGFRYVDADGRTLREPAALQRIRRLAIPPAYRDVWICRRADGHLQATGRDARGRKQYRYHPQWQALREVAKFDHLQAFGAALPRIRARVRRELDGGAEPTRERVLATLTRLLDTTWLRIGNEAYRRENGSFGLCTLRCRHAEARGGGLRLAFTGKAGVAHRAQVGDARVAQVVRRCLALPGRDLFGHADAQGRVRRVDAPAVNAWLAEAGGTGITAKDFRTWHANVFTLDLTLRACRTDTATSARDVVEQVARRLGNTAAVCRKSYIHPAVLALAGALGDAAARTALGARRWVRQAPALRGLAMAERRLMGRLATGA